MRMCMGCCAVSPLGVGAEMAILSVFANDARKLGIEVRMKRRNNSVSKRSKNDAQSAGMN